MDYSGSVIDAFSGLVADAAANLAPVVGVGLAVICAFMLVQTVFHVWQAFH